ncbi:MAG: ATPase [Beijerinckiaceae bacterium]|nr:MAG: ATPase [Beijerinckiaceae bacterium]
MPDDAMRHPATGTGQQNAGPPQRKRFYTRAEAAALEDRFAVLLDGKPVLTPAKERLALPTLASAEAVAAEWGAQTEKIDPTTLPLTRILNAALDGVAKTMNEVVTEIVKYASSDLVCYRAGEPASLVKAQADAWDPILAFIEVDTGARFICAEGIVHVAQPETSLAAIRARIDQMVTMDAGGAVALACLDVMTTLTGSALIAITLASNAITLEQAWAAAHVDEDFQMRLWGTDTEAMARRAQRYTEMEAAERLWRLVQG